MCGLFGFIDYGQTLEDTTADKLINSLATESAVRGTDATGLAYLIDNKLEIEKEAKSAREIRIRLPKDTHVVLGHTRSTTRGSASKKYNNHPFRGRFKNSQTYALAHNGIIHNDEELREKFNIKPTKIETDSYIAVQLLERGSELSFENIREMAEQISGSFTFTILDDQNNTFIIKGDSPLSIMHFTTLRLYVYASTEEILWRASSSSVLAELKSGQYEEVQIDKGKVLKISSDGEITEGEFQYFSHFTPMYESGWWDYFGCHTEKKNQTQDEYVQELKSVAVSLGFTPRDVDRLIMAGCSFEEIEEILYNNELEYSWR